MAVLLDRLGRPMPPTENGHHAGVTLSRKITLPSSRLIGGRATRDNTQRLFGRRLGYLSPPADQNQVWRANNYDEGAFDLMSTNQLLALLVELSPEASNALWTYLRLANPGFEVTAYRPGTATPAVRAQTALKGFLARLAERHGSIDVPINRLFIGAWLRGAFFGELVMDEAGTMGVDIATPDPATVRFREIENPGSGPSWELGQLQQGRFVSMNRPTVRYIPIDPMPGSPWGRPLVNPAVFSALFLLSMFHDLKRVIQQQGYPRIDVSVDLDKLREMFDEADTPDDLTFKTFIDSVIAQVQLAYENLKPDDAYIHGSAISVNRPVGTVSSDALGAVDSLIENTVRMTGRGLKVMPLMIGITDGVSEANANRQWEIQAAGTKALQHPCENLLARFCQLALQAEGIVADVVWRFAELRASEALRDEQTLQLKIQNAQQALFMNWIDQEEAAQRVVGHEAKGPAPDFTPQGIVLTGGEDPATANPTPGEDL